MYSAIKRHKLDAYALWSPPIPEGMGGLYEDKTKSNYLLL